MNWGRILNADSCISFVTQPNMYARGVLFGKMKYELGDHSLVKCPESGLEADIEFKTKGWVGGHYDEIGGFIKDSRTQKKLFELSGFWNGEMSMKDLHVSARVQHNEAGLLTLHRAARRLSYSTQHMHEKHQYLLVLFRSKKTTNRSVYGRSVQQR